jgi:iron(III) transport system permease protein
VLETLSRDAGPEVVADFGAPRSRRGRPLVLVAALVAGLLLLPLVFLVVQAAQVGGASLSRLLFRHLTGTLLWNTVSLLVTVGIGCAVIGTATAWCIERTNLPFRRVWAVLVVLPVAIPTSSSATDGYRSRTACTVSAARSW